MVESTALTCIACGAPSVRRGGRQLKSCGSLPCSTEIRARALRGKIYGDRGGGPVATTNVQYNGAHNRARKQLKDEPCALKDASCLGRSEVALRPGLPETMVSVDSEGRKYYAGLESSVGYRRLCRSHHGREGALFSLLARLSSEDLKTAVLRDLGYTVD